MQNYNSICNLIVPGQQVGRDEAGVKIDSTLYKQMVENLMYLTVIGLDCKKNPEVLEGNSGIWDMVST